jgi:bacterial surface protein 26-residue repeat/bacterial surface protein 26-residue repeat/bacterial surface protein 26-residue repeat/bacterial surface protein 26-residue repeat/bacterial surface protein 26-residue repeat/bacterial surface protein 26-residue repeat/bacterial surface protein 26-residue repeat/bacterial surface protein 26-residue repeat/bacterial surface protein 26-residue repeat
MFLKRNRKYNILKPHIIIFSFFLSFLSLFFIPQISVSAAPVPAHLSLSIVNPSVDFHFNQTENAAATFKQEMAVVEYSTDNSTGFTAYVSSIDEDTNLNHTDSSVTQKITSITSPRLSTSFDPKTWGYRTDQVVFNSIPKASLPDSAFSINHPEIAKFFLQFGVKTGPDLTSGTYSKKILVTAITNRVPTSTTFIPGQNFRDALVGLGALGVVKSFKHSTSAPPAGANTKIVSTADSDIPAYVWYDAASQSILWYSDADIAYANEDSSYMFYDIGNNSSNTNLIDTAGINTSRVKNMRFMFSGGKWIIKKIKITNLDTSNVEDMSYMFAASPYEQSITADPIDLSGFNTSKVTNMQGMFSGSHFPFIDIRHFDTSNVTNMESMFADLHKVTSLDLSGLNVKKVSNIQYIFSGSNDLQSLNLSGWELDSITSMYSLFSNLPKLTSLNLNGFTTKNVTDMTYMFAGTKKLANLDLSSFDTSKVTTMERMFQDMESLNSINLSSFDTSSVTSMQYMFSMNITNPPISTLDLSNFNTSNVTNMQGMFEGMANLTDLKIQSFDTRKVTNMNRMFYWTFMSPENSILDISNFDTRSLVSATGMFNYTKVKTIYVSDKFTVSHLSPSPTEMFMTNTNLVGGNGTHYVYPNNSSQYAHIDAPGNPGYFTQKP